jgi:hypothetical protein
MTSPPTALTYAHRRQVAPIDRDLVTVSLSG